MREAQPQEVQHIGDHEEDKEANPISDANARNNSTFLPKKKNLSWWIRIAMYTLILLVGQTVGTLLGRLYYAEGGNSKWMSGLVLTAGFPILLPLYLISAPEEETPNSNNHLLLQGSHRRVSFLSFASVYLLLGILQAGISMMYSIGYSNLPVSTYSLICASQLGFNALFSYFLNSLKFTPFIINSLVLLTISSILLVFNNNSDDSSTESSSIEVDKAKYAIGFICTLVASAGYGLILSFTQLLFRRVFKKETFKVVLDMLIYPSIVSTCILLVGLFASGEWKDLGGEMEEFKLGKVSYLMTLIWTAICWQVFSIGAIGLVFEVTSLFSNVISTLGLPFVPVLAVIIFHDQMNGLKVISMVLAFWGFVSYFYNHYLEDYKSKIVNKAPKASTTPSQES